VNPATEPLTADRHAAVILAALRRRPHSTQELAGLIDSTPREVSRVVARLRDEGEPIPRGVPGSHDGALYMLTTAPYMPPRTCATPGCGCRLSPTNPGLYCRMHKPRIGSVYDAILWVLERDVEGEAAAAASLFEVAI
jgi:hypothetical protein